MAMRKPATVGLFLVFFFSFLFYPATLAATSRDIRCASKPYEELLFELKFSKGILVTVTVEHYLPSFFAAGANSSQNNILTIRNITFEGSGLIEVNEASLFVPYIPIWRQTWTYIFTHIEKNFVPTCSDSDDEAALLQLSRPPPALTVNFFEPSDAFHEIVWKDVAEIHIAQYINLAPSIVFNFFPRHCDHEALKYDSSHPRVVIKCPKETSRHSGLMASIEAGMASWPFNRYNRSEDGKLAFVEMLQPVIAPVIVIDPSPLSDPKMLVLSIPIVIIVISSVVTVRACNTANKILNEAKKRSTSL